MKSASKQIASIAFLLFCAGSQVLAQDTKQPVEIISQVKTARVKIRILSPTGKPVSNSKVKIFNEFGTSCILEPCDSPVKTWTGKTDSKGFVVIPTKRIPIDATIATPKFRKKVDLVDRAELYKGYWRVYLSN
jgi:uncharacterized GH25 family protein